jgi:hypothetical protein
METLTVKAKQQWVEEEVLSSRVVCVASTTYGQIIALVASVSSDTRQVFCSQETSRDHTFFPLQHRKGQTGLLAAGHSFPSPFQTSAASLMGLEHRSIFLILLKQEPPLGLWSVEGRRPRPVAQVCWAIEWGCAPSSMYFSF